MLQHNSAMHGTLQCSSLNSGDGYCSARRAGIEPLHDHIATIPNNKSSLYLYLASVHRWSLKTLQQSGNARIQHA